MIRSIKLLQKQWNYERIIIEYDIFTEYICITQYYIDKEKTLKKHKQWYKQNPDKVKEYKKQNKEKIKK
jgi:hypothetical protein